MIAGEAQCGGAEELPLRQPRLQAHTIRTAAGSCQLHHLALQVCTHTAAAVVVLPAIAGMCSATCMFCTRYMRPGYCLCAASHGALKAAPDVNWRARAPLPVLTSYASLLERSMHESAPQHNSHLRAFSLQQQRPCTSACHVGCPALLLQVS
jgi:hypothetical protein